MANDWANDGAMVGPVATPRVALLAMDSIVDFDWVEAIAHFASIVVAYSSSIGASADPSHFDFAAALIGHRLAYYSISCPATWRTAAVRNYQRRRRRHQLAGNCPRLPFAGRAFVVVGNLAEGSLAAAWSERTSQLLLSDSVS